MKLIINIIGQMHGKMLAALNQFFYNVMKIRVGEAPTKIRAFSKITTVFDGM